MGMQRSYAYLMAGEEVKHGENAYNHHILICEDDRGDGGEVCVGGVWATRKDRGAVTLVNLWATVML